MLGRRGGAGAGRTMTVMVTEVPSQHVSKQQRPQHVGLLQGPNLRGFMFASSKALHSARIPTRIPGGQTLTSQNDDGDEDGAPPFLSFRIPCGGFHDTDGRL